MKKNTIYNVSVVLRLLYFKLFRKIGIIRGDLSRCG